MKCKDPKQPLNSQIIWLYSSNGIELFEIDNSLPNKYIIDGQLSLTILNLVVFDDDGYYACGTVTNNGTYFKSIYGYSLFVERKEILNNII